MSLADLVCPEVDEMVRTAVASAPPLPADLRRRLRELIRSVTPTDAGARTSALAEAG